MYITCNLQGGLGNQMFQIAAAESLASRLGLLAKFKMEAFTPMQANPPSHYCLNVFSKVDFSREDSGSPYSICSEKLLSMLIDGDIKDSFGTVVLSGYFQSEDFFADVSERVKKMFTFKRNTLKHLDWFDGIDDNGSISVHIRRGDYLTINSILPVVSKSYIDKALALHGPYSRMFIFSDDKEWAEKSLNYPRSQVVKGMTDYEEMWLMSLCSNNIISNSSFSWWASYLNDNQNKKVYAPSIWLGPDAEPFTRDIYRKDMIKVEVEYKEGSLNG